MSEPKLVGLVPENLKVRSQRIVLESLDVQTDIGFHDFEVGTPQRLSVTVEIWLDDTTAPPDDDPRHAWNYDFLRTEVEEIASHRQARPETHALANELLKLIPGFRQSGNRLLVCATNSK